MPVPQEPFTSETYRRASDLPPVVWEAFEAYSREANIMYPHALKSRRDERRGQFWITCTSTNPEVLDFILSCTEGPLGSYPIFIFTPHLPDDLDIRYIIPRVVRLIRALRAVVPDSRTYSVFAPDRISRVFAGLWTELTGIEVYEEPYYAAKLTHCSKRSVSKRQMTMHPDLTYELKLAELEDVEEVAELCYGFAAESEPFVLTMERALEEAALMVRNKQLWIHLVRKPGQKPRIASIVAFTRQSSEVSAITKVYTSPHWRRLGCAERLCRTVTKHLLSKNSSVVLYVAHNNPAAQKVYHRVGFAGLGANDREPVEGVSSWTEIGFDRTKVSLGHW